MGSGQRGAGSGRNGWRRGFNLALGLDGWDRIGDGLDWMEEANVVYPRLESGGLFTITGIFVSLLAEV